MVFLRPLPLDFLPLVKVRTGGMLPCHQELKSWLQTPSFMLALKLARVKWQPTAVGKVPKVS